MMNDIRYLIARLLEVKREMHYANGESMGYVSEITFGEDELKELESFAYGDKEGLIKEIDAFRLKAGQNLDWELMTGDVAINKSIWKQIKKKYLGRKK